MNYSAIESFDWDRTWWRLFQNRVIRTKFDINAFICTFVIFIYIWISTKTSVRDRPFNLKGGGGMVFCFVQNFFSNNIRVRIFIFFVRKARNFCPEFNIRIYDKNSDSDYYFFPPPKSEYFFQQHWESEYFFRKKP